MQEIITFIKEHIILSVTWISLLLIMLYTLINDWIYKPYLISRNKAIFLINQKNAIIIDIRDHQEFLTEHIMHSINISIEKIKNQNCSELKKFKKNPLIIVHKTSILPYSIIQQLKKLQFEQIYILNGGITSWKTDNLPVVCKNNKQKIME